MEPPPKYDTHQQPPPVGFEEQMNAPPNYYNQHQQPTHMVAMNQPVMTVPTVQMVTIMPQVGPDPAHVTCPNCNQSVSTQISKKVNTKAHIACGVLTLLGCWLCCCIPYFLDSFQKVEHKCPKCNALVGIYNK